MAVGNDGPGFAKLLASNGTSTSAFATPYSLLDPVTADPAVVAGVGSVIDLGDASAFPNVLFRFWGTAGATLTGEVRVHGLRRSGTLLSARFVVCPICSFTFTTGAMTGAANTNAGAGDYLADTLARLGSVGVDNMTDTIVSPAGLGIPASLMVDTRHFRYLMVELRRGTAASVNGEWAGVK